MFDERWMSRIRQVAVVGFAVALVAVVFLSVTPRPLPTSGPLLSDKVQHLAAYAVLAILGGFGLAAGRRVGRVASGAGLAGCDSKPNNDAASVMQTVPVVVNSAPPENVAAPVSQPKNLKNNRFPVSRETLAWTCMDRTSFLGIFLFHVKHSGS